MSHLRFRITYRYSRTLVSAGGLLYRSYLPKRLASVRSAIELSRPRPAGTKRSSCVMIFEPYPRLTIFQIEHNSRRRRSGKSTAAGLSIRKSGGASGRREIAQAVLPERQGGESDGLGEQASEP